MYNRRMRFVVLLLRAGALLLLVASLLLPSLAVAAFEECCPSCDAGNGGACPEDHREEGDPATGSGGAHSKAFCGCGSCDMPSFVHASQGLPSPALSGTVGSRMILTPPTVTIAALDRPPSA